MSRTERTKEHWYRVEDNLHQESQHNTEWNNIHPDLIWKPASKVYWEDSGVFEQEQPITSKEWNLKLPQNHYGSWLGKLMIIFSFVIIMSIIVLQSDHPTAVNIKQSIKGILPNNEFTQKVQVWLTNTFQSSSTLTPAFEEPKATDTQKVNASPEHYSKPVKGNIISPYISPVSGGITLETEPAHGVHAASTGRVIYAGLREGIGQTVVIQHTNGIQTWYGLLGVLNVNKNDWVESGQQVGIVSELKEKNKGYLYFAIKKDQNYINPSDVVKFD